VSERGQHTHRNFDLTSALYSPSRRRLDIPESESARKSQSFLNNSLDLEQYHYLSKVIADAQLHGGITEPNIIFQEVPQSV
jgi:hypothetical protein